MLSKQTLEHLLEAESHIRAAIKSAASNETPMTVQHLSKLLLDIENCRRFEKMMDMLDSRNPGSSGSFGSFLNE